jgi:hypothetical protein
LAFTLDEMAARSRGAATQYGPELAAAVAAVVETTAVRARSAIGHLQDGWEPLSGAMIYGFRHEAGFWITDKEDLGLSGPGFEPFRRGGELENRTIARADAWWAVQITQASSQ